MVSLQKSLLQRVELLQQHLKEIDQLLCIHQELHLALKTSQHQEQLDLLLVSRDTIRWTSLISKQESQLKELQVSISTRRRIVITRQKEEAARLERQILYAERLGF